MMRKTTRREVSIGLVRGLVVGVAVLLALTSCGPKEEEPAPQEVIAPKAAEALPPATRVLQLMPEQASLGAVILSPSRFVDKVIATSKRFVADEATIDAVIASWIAEGAQDLGVPDAKTFDDIATAAGIDGSAPMGVFFEMEAPEAPEEEAETPDEPEAPAAPEPSEGESDSAPAETTDEKLDQMLKDLEDEYETAPPPAAPFASFDIEGAGAVVLECTDIEKAKAHFEKPRGAAAGQPVPEPETQDGVTIVHRPDGDLYYLVAGNRFIAGDSAELVKAVAARMDDPIPVRYGSPECPADEADEVVGLVRADRLSEVMTQLSQAAGTGIPGGLSLGGGDTDLLSAYEGEDPVVVSFALDERRMELVARVDGATHPDMARVKGAVGPMTQAQLFPETALALVSLSLTPEAKQALQEAWATAMPEGAKQSPEIAQAMGTAQLVLSSIGNEITLGVGPSEGGLPTLLAAVDLANVEQTKAFLQTLGLPMEQKETYAGVDVLASPIPLPMEPPQSVYFAFPQNMVVLGNNLGEVKSFLDRLQSGSPSGLFAAQEPPLDPKAPREALIVLRGELLSGVVTPLLGIQGLLVPEVKDTMARVEASIASIRYEKDLDGTWYRDRYIVRLREREALSDSGEQEEAGAAG